MEVFGLPPALSGTVIVRQRGGETVLVKKATIPEKNEDGEPQAILIFVTPTIMQDDTTDFGGKGPLTPLF